MTEFQLTKDSAKYLLKMISLTDKLEKDSDGAEFYISTNKLIVCLHNITSNVTYDIDILNVAIDPNYSQNTFACINVVKFKAALTKCLVSNDNITIRINHEKKALTVQASTGTSITVNCFDTLSDSESYSILNYWQNKMNDPDFVGTLKVSITPEVLSIADITSKVITGDNENNILVLNQDKFIYVDRVALLYKTLSNPIPGTDTYYLPKPIIDFIKPFIKETKTALELCYSKDNRHIYFEIPAFNLKAIIGVADLTCDLPSDEDYANIIPEVTNHIKLKVTKANIIDALSKFDGIFDISEYRWKQIYWTISEDGLNKGVVQLHYDDFTAEVDTTMTVEVIENNAETSDFSFIIPGVILDNLISLIDENEIILDMSPVPSNEWHGRGIEVSSPTFKAVCMRFVE